MSELFVKVHDHLPVFKVDLGLSMVLYTPGNFLKINTIPKKELEYFLSDPSRIEDPDLRQALSAIVECARDASDKWEIRKQLPFSPECLTIHVGNDCNLNCTYCYSKSNKAGNKALKGFPSADSIRTVFMAMTEDVKSVRTGLTVVFHGSGEPTFHWPQLVDSVRDISNVAEECRQEVFFYIATNGCLTIPQIDWLSINMNLIGISCDGPDTIQNTQRNRGSDKYLPVDKVCRRILEMGGKFDMRVTVTPSTITHLKEITEYLIDECKARTIRIEPVFLAGENGFKEEDADVFYRLFTESRDFANQLGVTFDYAGLRMSELHGTYCDVLRNTLRLTVDGLTRNCFCFMSDNPGFITGRFNAERSEFKLSPYLNDLKKSVFQIPSGCSYCINIYHCSRGCPDFCISEQADPDSRMLSPFRCRLHQLFAVERIMTWAGSQNHFKLTRITK